jgi:hypothetical protein
MNCQEVTQYLPDFLANEITPSERKMIQSHLATCASCQNEVKVLAALQSQIRNSLHNQAAGAAPSPLAWSRLQARLDYSKRADHPGMRLSGPQLWKQITHKGKFTMKQTALTIFAVLALLAGTLAFVPDVRATVFENIIGWLGYDFPSPNNQEILSWGSNWGFTPYNPRYMPEGLHLTGSMVGGETTTEEVGLCYQPEKRQGGDPFIVIRETHLAAPGILPDGNAVNVNGIRGVLDELPAGEIEWCLGPSSTDGRLIPVPAGQDPSSSQQFPPDEPLTYDKAQRLTYFIEDIQVEIFGPYPEKELIRIAKSLMPVQPAEQQPEQPPQP